MGGRVEWLLEPRTPTELASAVRAARERGAVPRLLGGGANLIVEDGDHPGVVIATDRMARLFRPREGEEMPFLRDGGAGGVPPESDGDEAAGVLVAWAGAPLPGLVRASRELGWSGLEPLAGVPGQTGGGVAMNAGGRYGELWDVVERVLVVDPEGELVERTPDEVRPRYRDGNLGAAAAASAVLRLRPSAKAEVAERIRTLLAEKSAAQPLTERSCGCIFKNPDAELSDGRSAGELIAAAGCASLTRGAARVSPKHANFVINLGGARAADVLALIEEVRRRVRDATGVELDREARLWRRSGEAPPEAPSLKSS